MVIKTESHIRGLTPVTLLRTTAAGSHFVKFLSLDILVDLRVGFSFATSVQICVFYFRADGDDTQAPLRMEPRMLGPCAQDDLHVSITRRDWLLQEKQQLQVRR